MILNFIKHLIMALLLDAGAAFAFNADADAPVTDTVAVPQSCALPMAAPDAGLKVAAPDGAHS